MLELIEMYFCKSVFPLNRKLATPASWLLLFILLFFPSFSYNIKNSLFAQKKREAAYYYQVAQKSYEMGEYQKALDMYHNALEQNPAHTPSYLGAAKISLLFGDLPKASDYYRQVLKYNPNSPSAYTGLATIYIKKDQMKKAYLLLKKVRSKEPGNIENNYTLGLWHIKKSLPEIAHHYFKKVVLLQPNHVSSLVGIARSFIQRKQFPQAKTYLRKALQLDSRNTGIYKARGELSLTLFSYFTDQRGQNELLKDAYESYRIANDLAPHDEETIKKMLHLSFHLDQPSITEEKINILIRQKPNNAELYYLRSLLRLKSMDSLPEKFQKGIKDAQYALRLAPKNPFIRNGLENAVLGLPKSYYGYQLLRKELAEHRFLQATYFQKKLRQDFAKTYLQRCLQLNPVHQKAMQLELQNAKEHNDQESVLYILEKMKKSQGHKTLKSHYQLEKAVYRSTQNIAYREKLFNSIRSLEKPSFLRSSTTVLLLDLKANRPFSEYPYSSLQISRRLNDSLQQSGGIVSIKNSDRAKILDKIRSSSQTGKERKPFAVYYKPEYIRTIEELTKPFKGAAQYTERLTLPYPNYLIHGSYDTKSNGLIQLNLSLIKGGTGTKIASFSLSAKGQNSLAKLGIQLKSRLFKLLPVKGMVIRVRGDDIFFNLGAYDGINLKSRMKSLRPLPPDLSSKPVLEVKEVGAYISRARLLPKFRKNTLEEKDELILLRPKN